MAGFGPDWSDLPADLAQASLMLAAHHYDSLHDMAIAALPPSVTAMVDRFRDLRLGGRA